MFAPVLAAVSEHTSLDDLGARIEAAADIDPASTGRQQRKDIVKEALREVIKEWLDEQLVAVGKWSLRGIGLAAFAALVYFILTHTGWTQK